VEEQSVLLTPHLLSFSSIILDYELSEAVTLSFLYLESTQLTGLFSLL